MKERKIDKWGQEIELGGIIDPKYIIHPLVKITFAKDAIYDDQRVAPKQQLHNKEYLFRKIEDYIFIDGIFKEPPDLEIVGDFANIGYTGAGCIPCTIL